MLEQNRSATNGNCGFGNDRFREEIAAALGRHAPALAGRPPRRVVPDARQMVVEWES
jgi:hypothetical protein